MQQILRPALHETAANRKSTHAQKGNRASVAARIVPIHASMHLWHPARCEPMRVQSHVLCTLHDLLAARVVGAELCISRSSYSWKRPRHAQLIWSDRCAPSYSCAQKTGPLSDLVRNFQVHRSQRILPEGRTFMSFSSVIPPQQQ